MRATVLKMIALAVLVGLNVPGCQPLPAATAEHAVSAPTLRGTVSFALPREAQATLTEIANAATVSLIDASTGNTVASSVTDGSGAFVLTFKDFTPTPGTAYVLEAIKGLSAGAAPNRVGASAVRVRTLLFWNNGWQSLTNTTPGVGITVSVATTALATVVNHKQQAGAPLTLSSLVGKVNGTTGAFDETGTGISNASDFQPVLTLVSNAITLDQDPLAAISYNASTNTYALATGIPNITGYGPTIPVPGSTLTLRGNNFDTLGGRNAFWFGSVPASTWSVSTDKTSATVSIPATAYSGPFTLQQPNGVTQTITSFLKLKGTVGTLAGNGQLAEVDGKGPNASLKYPIGVAFNSAGDCYVADYGGNSIRRIKPDGTVTTFATVSAPYGLAFDSHDNLYVALANANSIQKITPTGSISLFAGTGTVGEQNGPRLSATFTDPAGIAIDSSDNLYVSEYNGNSVRKIDPSGNVTTLATVPGAYGIAVNPAGTLYVAALRAKQIVTVSPTGTVTVLAGSGTAAVTDGSGLGASFHSPIGLGLDPAGNVYVAEEYSYVVRKVTPTGDVSTLAGGTQSYADGSLANARFNSMYHCTYYQGHVYICDFSGNRLRVLTP